MVDEVLDKHLAKVDHFLGATSIKDELYLYLGSWDSILKCWALVIGLLKLSKDSKVIQGWFLESSKYPLNNWKISTNFDYFVHNAISTQIEEI